MWFRIQPGLSAAILPFLAALLVWPPDARAAEPWNLPQSISDANTTVTFTVDSTWHLVEGTTAGLHGFIRLADPADPLSLQIEVTLPVNRFDTDRASRDEKLRTVMGATHYPEVFFRGSGARVRSGVCRPEEITLSTPCGLDITGELRIGAITQPVVLPVNVTPSPSGFAVEGELPLEWATYGVADPSILIARLEPTVTVRVRVELVRGPHTT